MYILFCLLPLATTIADKILYVGVRHECDVKYHESHAQVFGQLELGGCEHDERQRKHDQEDETKLDVRYECDLSRIVLSLC